MVELRAFSLKLFADLVKCLMVMDRQEGKMVKNLKWINGKHEFRLKYRKYGRATPQILLHVNRIYV